MPRPKSTISAVTPKIILALAFLCLMIPAIFGLLGSYRVDALRADVAKANAAWEAAEHRRVAQEAELKTREMAVAGEEAKIVEAENRAATAGAELAQSQKEKTELRAKLEEKQNEIGSLQKRIEEAGTAAKPSENPTAASTPKKQSISPPPPEPVEETTPPPPQPKRGKTSPARAPEVGASAATISFSSAKALATFAPLPKYPLKVRSDGVTGSGVCVVSVDQASGRVTGASMEQSTGDSTLDKSAVRAFRKWQFKPGTVSKIRIPIEFTMTGASH